MFSLGKYEDNLQGFYLISIFILNGWLTSYFLARLIVLYDYFIIRYNCSWTIIQMGFDQIYILELLNTDNNTSTRQQLKSPSITYKQIVELIESYYPQVDIDTLTIYYFSCSKWLFMLDSDSFSMDYNINDYQEQGSDNLVFRVRFHCYYFVEQEQERRIVDDIATMNQQVQTVHELYHDLKDKYKQQPLDINVFWGSPLFTNDGVQRSKKPNVEMNSLQNQKLNLLGQRVKYPPFINAVSSALQGCEKKVKLYLNQLNKNCFRLKNIFTVVYIIAHLELEETGKKKADNTKQKQKKVYIQKVKAQKNLRAEVKEKIEKPSMKKQTSQSVNQIYKINLLKNKPKSQMKNQQCQQISEETQQALEEPFQRENGQLPMKMQEYTRNPKTSLGKCQTPQNETESQIQYEEELKKIKNTFSPYNSHSSGKTKSHGKSQRKQQNKRNIDEASVVSEDKKCYLLGEELDGSLCKITPKQLIDSLSHKIRNIQLLILHTSYPQYHLKQLRKQANNIILINSNPLVPEPSTIFYIKQLFTHLIETGDIQWAYNSALKDLNMLKELNLSENDQALENEFAIKDIQFIKSINQKYVHGSLDCCCCYHSHHPKCRSYQNQSPSKYAEYHYHCHSSQCQCPMDNINIHSCQAKKKIMTRQYGVLSSDYDINENKFYYCCCRGKEEGYYSRHLNNHQLLLYNIDEQKDVHSITNKYKHQKTMSIAQDNQLQIWEGRLQGDCRPELFEAFRYIGDNPIIGNEKLIIWLLQVFTATEVVTKKQDEEVRKLVVCNLYGQKSTGRKSIATYFGNMLVIRKICQRVVIKIFHSADELKDIIQSNYKGRPLLILIHQDKDSRGQRMPLQLHDSHFPKNVLVIFLTEQRLQDNSNLGIKFFEPEPFKKNDCTNFVKKYRHLSFKAKRSVEKLFDLGIKDIHLYPCSINEFQILHILKNTVFDNDRTLGSYLNYANALGRMNEAGVPTYVFVMSLIKFTKSPNYLKESSMMKISQKLKDIKKTKSLFYKGYNGKPKEQKEMIKDGVEDQQVQDDQLISTNRIRDNYYFIYLCFGHKMVNHIATIFKLFINYTTVIEWHRNTEVNQGRKKLNQLRMKMTPFVQQVYQATTINPDSYIRRYFKTELSQIQSINLKNQDFFGIEDFVLFHAQIFETKRHLFRRLTNECHSNTKPKDKDHKRMLEMSLDMTSHQRQHSKEQSQKMDQPLDIRHIYHLSSIIEGGLQYLRSVLCSHFIYNILKDDEKIDLLKHGIFLINNCIILMKNQHFMQIQQDQDEYDIESTEQAFRDSQFTLGFVNSSQNLQAPDNLILIRSSFQPEMMRPISVRGLSSSSIDFFNPHRQFQAVQRNYSRQLSEREVSWQNKDQLLSKELYRLSTYKGLLFLLAELERRSQEMSADKTAKIKIQIQLMAIQIRLQQLQIQKEDKKNEFAEGDRHMERICQIFNDKKHNINALYKILRQQIRLKRFSRDPSQLSMIKSYIIVALSLMASSYGKFKIVRAQSMINEIQIFLDDWNYIPLNRRDSQREGHEKDRDELSKISNLPLQFGFMRFISQNQYIYLFIVVESFSSKNFWRSSFLNFHEAQNMKIQKKKSQYSSSENKKTYDFGCNKGEIEIYQQILSIYHLFTLRNTKSKLSEYKKLEYIQQKLQQYKQIRRYYSFSTYIYNFMKTFQNKVMKEFKHLKPHLILILTAEDDNNYIKISLKDKINQLINKKGQKNSYFTIKRKFNQLNIKSVTANSGCKYLCLFTSTGANNGNKDIIIETNEGISQINNKEKLAELLASVSTTAIFVCLPQKKNLAESLLRNNHHCRTIVYFDFNFANFEKFKQNKQTQHYVSASDDMIIFEKMIMIESVKQIISGIIEEQNNGFRLALQQSFKNVKNSLWFVLKDHANRPIMRLTNEQFKMCIFIEGTNEQQKINSKQFSLCQIQLFESQRVNKEQMQELQKIGRFTLPKILQNREKLINLQKIDQFRIDSFVHVHHFIEVFEFYFKDKYGFDNFFAINLELLGSDIKKKFLQKLVGQNILDFIFSDKKGIIVSYVDKQNSNKYQEAFKQCESELKSILKNCDQLSGKRIISKLVGGGKSMGNRKVSCINIYVFQQLQ